MSKFYPASKNSTNPLKNLLNNDIKPITYQISGIKFPISSELYGNLNHPRIFLCGSGIPENVILNFPENETSGIYPKISGTAIFSLTHDSIQIDDGGSGNTIGDEFFIYSSNSPVPAYIIVSSTGINGSVTDYDMYFGGYNFNNNSLLSIKSPIDSIRSITIPPQISLVPDKYSICDFDISTYGSGYAISKNFVDPCTYVITTNNLEHNFLAISTVYQEPIFDINDLSLFTNSKRDNFLTNNFLEKSQNFKYNENIGLKLNVLTLHNKELNNFIQYQYTLNSSCMDDSDCSFCASGVLISNAGSCGGFICEEYGSMINPADPCPEGWEGSNGICSKYTQAASCEECNYGIAPEGMTDYGTGCSEGEPCYEKCCPEGSTGVFPVGDPRAGRCCEDCSETSTEEGQSGWLLTEGYCVDGQCSETPASTGVIPSGENPASSGCVEDIYIPESLCWEFPSEGYEEESELDLDSDLATLIAGGLVTPSVLREWAQLLADRAKLISMNRKKYPNKTIEEIIKIADNELIKKRGHVFPRGKGKTSINSVDIANISNILKNSKFLERMGLDKLDPNDTEKILRDMKENIVRRIKQIRESGDDLTRYDIRESQRKKIQEIINKYFKDPKTGKIDWLKWLKYQQEQLKKAKCPGSIKTFKGKSLGCAIGVAIALGGSQAIGEELSDILDNIPPTTPVDLLTEYIMNIIFEKLIRNDTDIESVANDIYSSYINGEITISQLKDVILTLANDGNSSLLRQILNKFNIDISSLTTPTSPLDLINPKIFLDRVKEQIDNIQLKIIQERIKQLENTSYILDKETMIIDRAIEQHIINFYDP